MSLKSNLLTAITIIVAIVLIIVSFYKTPITDAFTIIALILGPIIAVRLEGLREEKKQKTDVKKYVFRILMATRRYPEILSPEHYRAINTVYMDFYGSKKVIEAARKYISHLNSIRKREDPEGKQWNETQKALLVELLHKMAKDLKYDDITHSDLADDAYVPAYNSRLESNKREIECQDAIIKLMRGEITIPISFNNGVNSSLIDSGSLTSEKVN